MFIVCLSLYAHPLAPGPSMHSLQVQPLCSLFRNLPLPFIPYETLQGAVATEQPRSVNLHLRAAAGAAAATRPLGGTMWKTDVASRPVDLFNAELGSEVKPR